MRIAGRPEWAWHPPEGGPWWSPASVYGDLTTDTITPAHVLPRLAGCGHDACFDDEWVDRFRDRAESLVDDDPHLKQVPGPMSRRWMRLLAEALDGDRSEAVARLATAGDDERIGEDSLRLRDLQLLITTATVDGDAWPPSGWLGHGSYWWLNGGLLTAATLLDLVELQAELAPRLLPGAAVFGVVADPDEGDSFHHQVIAAFQVGERDPGSTVSREAALGRIEHWLARDPLDPFDVPAHVHGYHNKTASHGLRGLAAW